MSTLAAPALRSRWRVPVGALRLDRPAGRRAAVGVLLAATAALYTAGLAASGWGNSFYAAAAQAGAANWRAFVFGSLDPVGAVTVDKPPASLWLMAVSLRLWGPSSWALLLPQAACGVASVGLLYLTVRRQSLGTGALRTGAPVAEVRATVTGLVAGGLLATTPAMTLMSRYDNPDALMVLLLVAGAYALVRSLDSPAGGARWLVAAGALLGTAFLTKLLQAWLVLPPFAAVALVAGAGPLHRRLARTAAAGAAMVAAAGWWIALVQLTPASRRPWIGGTRSNSALELALGYNGLGRITGEESSGGTSGPTGGGTWTRLLGSWAPEASWLLPAALAALVTGWLLVRRRDRRDPARAGLLLWGGWLLVVGLVFSVMHGISHGYYAVQLAPAVAAGLALGGSLVGERLASRRLRRVSAAVLAASAVWSGHLLVTRTRWPVAVLPLVAVAAVLALALLAGPWRPRGRSVPLLVASLVVLAAGPLTWSVATAATAHRGALVAAGPGRGTVVTPPAMEGGLVSGADLPTALAATVRAGATGHRWAAAVVGRRAADLELASGVPVEELGGFNGGDPYPTRAGFLAAVAAHQVRYLVAPAPAHGGIGPVQQQLSEWGMAGRPVTHVGGWSVVDLDPANGRTS